MSDLFDRLNIQPIPLVQRDASGKEQVSRRRLGRVEALEKFRKNLGIAAEQRNPLQKAILTLGSAQELVTDLDPEDEFNHTMLFAAVTSGLSDILYGRRPPEWLVAKFSDRPCDGNDVWINRAYAVCIYLRAIEFGVPRKEALAGIAKTLKQRGMRVASTGVILEWRKRFRRGDVPSQAALEVFRQMTDGFKRQPRVKLPKDIASDVLNKLLLPEMTPLLRSEGD